MSGSRNSSTVSSVYTRPSRSVTSAWMWASRQWYRTINPLSFHRAFTRVLTESIAIRLV